MPRCPAEEAEVMADFVNRLRARPQAGFVVGMLEPRGSDFSVLAQVSDVGCTPLCLVSAASALLATAAERVRALPDPHVALELLCGIERARAALDFTLPADAH